MSKPLSATLRAKRVEQLQKYMEEHGLKSTKQRDLIVQTFFETTDHIRVEDLYARAKAKDPTVGFATVYRTMKMLTDSGLANRRDFGDGHARYENTYAGEHHDHVICTGCGEIAEFESEALQPIKKDIAHRKGFQVQYHKLELYGLCRKCQKGARP